MFVINGKCSDVRSLKLLTSLRWTIAIKYRSCSWRGKEIFLVLHRPFIHCKILQHWFTCFWFHLKSGNMTKPVSGSGSSKTIRSASAFFSNMLCTHWNQLSYIPHTGRRHMGEEQHWNEGSPAHWSSGCWCMVGWAYDNPLLILQPEKPPDANTS